MADILAPLGELTPDARRRHRAEVIQEVIARLESETRRMHGVHGDAPVISPALNIVRAMLRER